MLLQHDAGASVSYCMAAYSYAGSCTLINMLKICFLLSSDDCFYCLQASKVTFADDAAAQPLLQHQGQAAGRHDSSAQPSLPSAVAQDDFALPQAQNDTNGQVSAMATLCASSTLHFCWHCTARSTQQNSMPGASNSLLYSCGTVLQSNTLFCLADSGCCPHRPVTAHTSSDPLLFRCVMPFLSIVVLVARAQIVA